MWYALILFELYNLPHLKSCSAWLFFVQENISRAEEKTRTFYRNVTHRICGSLCKKSIYPSPARKATILRDEKIIFIAP